MSVVIEDLDLDSLMGFAGSPTKFKPHGYQEDAIGMKLSQDALGLFWDMGLGKTGTVLEILRRANRSMFPALLVAPLRCCTDVWPLEIKKFGFDFSSSLIHSGGASKDSAQIREAALRRRSDIYLVNPEGLIWVTQYLSKHKIVPFNSLIVDESTKFKNPTAKRTKALASMVPHIKHRMILTGTPISQGYQDLWAQIYLLDEGESLGKRFAIYKETWFTEDQWGQLRPRPGACQEIDKRIAHLIHRGDAGVHLDMPELIVNRITIRQPPLIMSRIDEVLHGFVSSYRSSGYESRDLNSIGEGRKSNLDIAKSIFAEFDLFSEEIEIDGPGGSNDDFEVRNAYAALRTLCSGFQYFPIYGCKVADKPEQEGVDAPARKVDRLVEQIHRLKLDVTEELIEGIGGKNLLIAFNFHEEREQLISRFACPVIDSRTSNKQASLHIQNWCDGKYPVMAIQPKSVGHGINLQAGGHHLLWYSPPNSLDDYLQTNARLYRQGQSSGTVTIHAFVSMDSVEERVITALESKEFDLHSLLNALLEYGS